MVAASVLVGVPVQLSGAQTRAEFTASWSTTSIAEGSSSTLTVSTADTSVMDADEILVTLHVGRAESTADTSDIEVRDSGGNLLSPQAFSANSDHGGGSVYIKQAQGETISPLVTYQQAKTAVFTVTTLDDADTSDEDLAVWVYVNGYLAGAQTLSLTTDPAFTFGSRSYTATEGGTAATVEVRLPEAPSSTLTIPIEVKSRVGATAADHSTVPSTLTFTTSDTAKTFTVTAVDDTDDDDGESITIGFGTPVPTGYVATDTTVVNLADNDAILVSNTAEAEEDVNSLGISDLAHAFTTGTHTAGYTLNSIELRLSTDGGTEFAVPIVKLISGNEPHTGTATTLTGPSSLDAYTTKNYAFTAPSGTTLAASTTYWVLVEKASSGGDDVQWAYTASTGEDTKEAGWSIADEGLDRDRNSTGSFGVALSSALMLRINGSLVTGPAFKFGSRSYTATEGGTAATVEVELVNSPGGPSSSVTVPIEVKTRVGAAAADHSTVPSSLTFSTSDRSKTFTVTATDDTDDDDGESIIIGFGTAPTGYTLVGDTIVSLADNDAILVSNTAERENDIGELSARDFAQGFTTGSHTAGYTIDSIELTLSTDSGTNHAVPIVKLVSGSAAHTGTATTLTGPTSLTANTTKDYTFTAPSGTTLAASTTYWAVVEASSGGNDVAWSYTLTDEDTKQAGWSIADSRLARGVTSTGSFSDVTSGEAQMLRINGSFVTGPAFKFGSRTYTATEGGTAATVEVELVNSPGGPSSSVTVPIEVKTRVGATAADHSTVPSSLTFTTSDTRKTFTVTATDDTDDDKGESIIIGFGTAPTGYTLVGDTVVNLVDDEPYVLVSNIDETQFSKLPLGEDDLAQAFTTGTHTAGYTLTSVELRLQTSDSSGTDYAVPIVKLISGTAAHTGTPTTLTGPSSLDDGTSKNYTFTAPTGTTLTASTTYWILVEAAASGGDDVQLAHTESTSEDTKQTNWSIADSFLFRTASSTGVFTTSMTAVQMLRLNGHFVGGL